jgi:RND family efflux transporter MFP subunit
LRPSGSVTEEAFDQARFDRAEAEASLEAAEAATALAQLNLEYSYVLSPITGRISRRLVDPGNLVQADETPLATIVSVDPMYAYFDVDERTVLRLRRLAMDGTVQSSGSQLMNVQFALADEEDFTIPGKINFFDNQVDPATGTLRMRAVIANPKGFLSPGLFVRLRVPVGAPHEALLVREEALGTDQGQRFLYVVDDKNEVAYRRVKVGLLTGGRRVIESGLKPNERVVVTGLQRVRPGTKVLPKVADNAHELAQSPAPKR